eukprot:CAMPEP_0184679374 /NCGR_PEP_ID=MMETSP0312-20130426/2212_1 /TAXON_ID=31354 /ORGANISM="Compsopogon coeruleus, Strain SAG 36.94" /LENGTH=321 /DNA_ID=CAMNT_0027128773 /DNA_START=63 /DNA_END=1028 /DNA_ORIENTATION=+
MVLGFVAASRWAFLRTTANCNQSLCGVGRRLFRDWEWINPTLDLVAGASCRRSRRWVMSRSTEDENGGGAPTRVEFGTFSIADPSKVKSEDRFFVVGNTGAVLDGVGGWATGNQPVDIGPFMDGLSHQLRSSIEISGLDNLTEQVDLSVQKVAQLAGSTTVLIAGLDTRDSTLRGVIIGDSLLAVIRKNRIVYQTAAGSYSFNFPFQVGMNCSPPREVAQLFDFRLQVGDWILLATDGLWDNLFGNDILACLAESDEEPDTAAKVLGSFTLKLSASDRLSPFEHNWNREAAKDPRLRKYRPWSGGKPDDITLIVGKVSGGL